MSLSGLNGTLTSLAISSQLSLSAFHPAMPAESHRLEHGAPPGVHRQVLAVWADTRDPTCAFVCCTRDSTKHALGGGEGNGSAFQAPDCEGVRTSK